MLKAKFDIEELMRGSDRIAFIAPAQELFSWTARSIRIPEGWVALVSRERLDALVRQAGETCESNGVRDVLLVRSRRLSTSASHSSLESSDGFACVGQIVLPLRVLADREELSAFRRTLLTSHDSLLECGLHDYLKERLERVLWELSGKHKATELVAGLEPSKIQEAIDRLVGPECLRAGLMMDGLARVSFESPAWAEHRRGEDQAERRRRHVDTRRQVQEAVSAAQREQLEHLLKIIERLKEAGESHRPLTELLVSFSDAERGQFYGALWHLPPPTRTRYLATVSGQEVLLFETTDFRKPARRIQLPNALGPLRSITCGSGSEPVASATGSDDVFVGAATGVFSVNIAAGLVQRMFRAPTAIDRRIRGGFNAVTQADQRVFATHSELGLIAWRLSDDEQRSGDNIHERLTRGATTVRSAKMVSEALWFSADERLWAAPIGPLGDGEPIEFHCGSATVTALFIASGVAYVGDASGAIFAFETGDPDSRRVIRHPTGQPVESLHAMDVSGVPMLIVADRSTALTALVVGDRYARRYEAGSIIVRRAAAVPDLFVAMDDGRERLLVWDPRRADAPTASIVIPYLTGGALQDFTLIS